MGRYARLALAEREEIVLLRRGGLRRDGRSGGRRRSDRQQGDGRNVCVQLVVAGLVTMIFRV